MSKDMKILLTFAHRGEAQSFFEQFTWKPVDFFFDGLFVSDEYFLLITGEGPHNASEKTIAVLSKLNQNISEVYNLGIAGSLNAKLKRNDLVWIRTAYAHHAEKLEFKSFTTANANATHDCMSAYNRILTTEERRKLSLFANVVDRELWAVASGAHLFKLPVLALKIISDDMEMAATSEDICKFVKNEAPAFSKALLEEFKAHQKTDAKKPHLPKSENAKNSILDDADFYFTTSQERKLNSTIDSLRKLGVDTKSLDIEQFRTLELSPKDRSRQLLQYLNDELNPMAKKIRSSLLKKLTPLSDAAIIPSFDADFEADWLNLNMRIQSSRDLERIKNALKIFSYEDYKKVLNGEIE